MSTAVVGGFRGLLREWSVARVTWITDLTQGGRVLSAVVMLTAQLVLVKALWHALYHGVGTQAGLDERQATTYALLAVLYTRFRMANRYAARDTVLQHVLEGSVGYWFLRPVDARRYYLIRAVGDLAYGAVWGAAAGGVCLALGVIAPPASASAGAAAAASMVLGLVLTYYLQSAIELLCFWTVVNAQAFVIYQFAQNFLSGAFAPLVFFPAWFVSADAWLPFQGTLNVPISLYVGQAPLDALPHDLLVQVVWCLLLAVFVGWLWRLAARRVTVLGG